MERNKKGQFIKRMTPWNKGMPMKEISKKKLSEKKKGQTAWNKGKKRYWKSGGEFRKGMIPWNKGTKGLQVAWNKGKHCPKTEGKNNGFWKGGITSLITQIRHSLEYKQWRHSIFTRDKYTCCECHKVGTKLQAHHIKSFALIIKRNKIETLEQAIKCNELWDTDNGITLCIKCHKLTDSYLKNIANGVKTGKLLTSNVEDNPVPSPKGKVRRSELK